MIRVGIIGATGYTGEELVGILSGHKKVKLTSLSALVDKPEYIQKIFPRLDKKISLLCKKCDMDEVIQMTDVVFLALPHTVSMLYAPRLLKAGKKVIDLSADYRLPADVYEKWYGVKHKDKKNLKGAVYGLPELYKDRISSCSLLANPGCYPTGVILALAPLVNSGLVDSRDIIVDAKSGVTGAGRKASLALLFAEIADNFKAYKIGMHQHTPEITEQIGSMAGSQCRVLFVPHVLPMRRGILSTIYLKPSGSVKSKDVEKAFSKFYADSFFVRICEGGRLPELKDVINTNFCDIGYRIAGGKIVVVAAVDNLLKGAAGQAVQNMNIMTGLDETEGFQGLA